MKLDDELRARLGALAQKAQTGLDDAARARVRARLNERVEAQPRALPALWLAVSAACVLVVAGLALRRDSQPGEPRAGAAPAGAASASAAPRPETRDVPAPPACAGTVASQAQFVARAGREAQLELPRARLVHRVGSAVSVAQLNACQLGLQLMRGDVAVHARDLQGGSLWIESALGRVVVRGTIFAVRADARGLRISVAEGRVLVEPSSRMEGGPEQAFVDGGQVLSVAADGALNREPLSPHERSRLLARLSLGQRTESSSARPAPGSPAPDIAGTSTRVWQRGAIDSHQAEPREPASSLQPDGRPMKKPQVTK